MENLSYYRLVYLAIIAIIIGGSASFVPKAESDKIQDFLLIIETTDKEVILSCEEGCAWNELSFGASANSGPQGINQYGMARPAGYEVKEYPELPDFLFTIERTENRISLGGINGTAWKSLSFSCPSGKCNQAVDQNGMVIWSQAELPLREQ